MTDREEFEAWARPLHYILDPDAFSGDCSFYHSPETRTAWAIWQAARAQPAQEPDLWKTQFLTDVMTSAGLIMHGRTDKKLAQRIADGSARWRTELYTHSAPTQPALSESDIRAFKDGFIPVFDNEYLDIYFGLRRRIPDLATRAIVICDDEFWGRGDPKHRRAVHYGLMREKRAIEAHCRGGVAS